MLIVFVLFFNVLEEKRILEIIGKKNGKDKPLGNPSGWQIEWYRLAVNKTSIYKYIHNTKSQCAFACMCVCYALALI